MKKITLLGLCLIGLTTFLSYAGSPDRAAPDVDPDVAEFRYRPGDDEGVMRPPSRPGVAKAASTARVPSYELRSLPVDAAGEEGTIAISLASDDFDEDGVPDLLCGHAGAGGNFVTLHRGNVDSIFPFSAAARRGRAAGTFTNEPFLDPARAFEIGIRPDFLGAGDFDNDGDRDVVVGAIDGTSLLLLAGDGSGELRDAGTLPLPGRLTALLAGDVNRRDGLADLVVAIVGPEGPVAMVFEGYRGAFHSRPEVLSLPAPATDLALGPLSGYAAIDLVIGAERQLLIVKGRDRKTYLGPKRRAEVGPPEVTQIDLDASVRAIATGDFTSDSDGIEIAALLDDGTLRLFGPGETADSWTVVEEQLVGSSSVGPRSLQATRLSGSYTQDLVVLDPAGQRLVVVAGGETVGTADLGAPPIALLPMRLNPDALIDLVAIEEGGTLGVALSSPAAVITVDTASDTAVPGDGSCSLREAILNANADTDTTGGDCVAGSGADTIQFNAGLPGSIVIISPTSPLPVILDSVTLDGNSQGCSSGPCVELRGSLAGVTVNGLALAAGSSTVRGLVVREFDLEGILLQSAGNYLEGNFVGTDRTGSVAWGNTASGIKSEGIDNTIGGTARGMGNLVSGNGGSGIRVTDPGAANLVQGNLVGTDAAGTTDLGNTGNGIVTKWSPGNVIGGTIEAARNVVSGNDISGIRVNQPETVGNLVQGNFAGTDITGTNALGNTNSGIVTLNGATDNTIGGTAVGAGNLASANTWGIICYSDANGTLIVGNYAGTDVTGTVALGNLYNGVQIELAPGNTVGGAFPGPSNLVSGNELNGVVIWYAGSSSNEVLGNYVGTDVTGTLALPNLDDGVMVIEGATDNVIGGVEPWSGNLISGNGDFGVVVRDGATQNTIQGNLIGTDITGTAPLGNTSSGIIIQDAPANTVGGPPPAGNLISANGSAGVVIYYEPSSSNQVVGNLIGTDLTGTVALGNVGDGVYVGDAGSNVVGGTFEGAGNVISANNRGVIIQSSSGVGSLSATLNQVQGNFIGTDVTGTADLGNVFHGVVVKGPHNLVGGTDPGARNVISGNDAVGVWLREPEATDNRVLGNFIGVDASGTVPLGNAGYAGVRLADGATDNTVGGTSPAARNIISGNIRGVLFDRVNTPGTKGNQILGNFIGTDVTGTVDLGNDLAGVLIKDGTDNTIGGTAEGAGNLVSGNGTNGVAIVALDGGEPSANRVQGNLIGTDVTGTLFIGNDDDGVIIENSSRNLVGGTDAGAGNLVAGNGECGVEIFESTPGTTFGNAILGNSIDANALMGIDLADDGVTPNDSGDPDTGPNRLQNYPGLTLADATPMGATIDGTFNSAAGRPFRLEFFASAACDASGCGEGDRYLGFHDLTTDGSGDATFSVALPGWVSDGDSIAATATDSGDNTSEFSDCLAAVCQWVVVLGQTIRAQDVETLAWAAASDVSFVKGDLAGVGSYSTTGDGTLFAATSLDISGDTPMAGDGVYYLVRPLGCGSWQTALGDEPARDLALP